MVGLVYFKVGTKELTVADAGSTAVAFEHVGGQFGVEVSEWRSRCYARQTGNVTVDSSSAPYRGGGRGRDARYGYGDEGAFRPGVCQVGDVAIRALHP